ncbi:hypothetical protein BOTBODRAFT_118701, partial [Botryobasidium botryosum FD-172 SS1]
VIPMIDDLHEWLEKAVATSPHRSIVHAAQCGLAGLNKYYSLTDETHMYRFSLLLHPNYKTDYMKDQEWKQVWINESLRLLREVWKEDYAPKLTADQPATAAAATPDVETVEFGQWKRKKRAARPAETLDQLESYLAQEAFDCNDPLAYWC